MSGGESWSAPRHAAFASHERTRAAFHAAEARFLDATRKALVAGQRHLAAPHDRAAHAAYQRALQEEAAASQALADARAALMANLRGPSEP